MTLCIVWRDDSDVVHLASDSRISVADSTEDVAVKVTRLRCEIFPPSSTLDYGSAHYAMDIAITFAGSHLSAYVIKESLVEVLSRLQYVPGDTQVSMARVAKLAFAAYESLSKKVCAIPAIAEKGICELFLSGYCPLEGRVRVFRFSTSRQNQSSSREILLGAGVESIGSGAKAATKSAHYPHEPLRALLDVIEDDSVPSVGGALQYARHEGAVLRVYADWQLRDDVHYMRAGLDINALISSGDNGDLFIAPLVIAARPEPRDAASRPAAPVNLSGAGVSAE
jgi:hypothetical protein